MNVYLSDECLFIFGKIFDSEFHISRLFNMSMPGVLHKGKIRTPGPMPSVADASTSCSTARQNVCASRLLSLLLHRIRFHSEARRIPSRHASARHSAAFCVSSRVEKHAQPFFPATLLLALLLFASSSLASWPGPAPQPRAVRGEACLAEVAEAGLKWGKLARHRFALLLSLHRHRFASHLTSATSASKKERSAPLLFSLSCSLIAFSENTGDVSTSFPVQKGAHCKPEL